MRPRCEHCGSEHLFFTLVGQEWGVQQCGDCKYQKVLIEWGNILYTPEQALAAYLRTAQTGDEARPVNAAD